MAAPPFPELLAGASQSAIHLEMRDAYVPSDPSFIAWQGGPPYDRSEREERWHRLIGDAVGRGVVVRRARIVSEPLSPYIQFEHAVTDGMNIAAGEQVRWLPRSRTLGLCLPGLDFWIFDDHTMRAHHFSGEGEIVEHELVTDPALIKHCAEAFEAIWRRAIPHKDYRAPRPTAVRAERPR